MKISENFSLKNFNSFGIDAVTRFFTDIYYEEDLVELFSSPVFSSNNKKIILGGGSNILLTGNFDGLTIKNSIAGIKKVYEDSDSVTVEAGAGVIWNDLVIYSLENNWGGLENLSLIPGTVGAAPMQNIGAYGQEIKNVFRNLEGYFISGGTKKNFSSEECNFGYRESIFKHELKNKFIITKVRLSLRKNPEIDVSYGTVRKELEKLGREAYTIRDVSNVICKIRREKLPDPAVIGNAGSFFKNPIITTEKFNQLKKDYPEIVSFPTDENLIKLAAGWLIEKCGWKGKRLGKAGTHEKQSLVLVNYGGASGSEILEVAEKIKESVLSKFGIELREEVNIY